MSEKIEKRAQDETEVVSRALVFFATIFFVFSIKNAGRQRTEEGKEKHPFFSRENIEKNAALSLTFLFCYDIIYMRK